MYATDVKTIDELIFGGFPEQRVSGIFALPNTGKSLLATQVMMNAIHDGKKCLHITTPSEYDSDKIAKIFLDRFKVDKIPDYCKVLNSQAFGAMLNIYIDLDKSKDKISIQIRDMKSKEIKERKTNGEWTREDLSKYDLIVLDSFSEMIKLTMVMEPQNLGARSIIETQLFGAMTECMEEYGNTFILTHHASVNPIAFADKQNPFGGPVLMYLSKYLILLKKADKPLFDKVGMRGRRVQRYRWTGSMESEFKPVMIKEDYGYADLE